jgi:hypothetical protein
MAEDPDIFDTSITRTFRGAPGKLALTLTGALLFMVLCLAVATGYLPGITADGGDVILGWIGAAFFGFLAYKAFERFMKGRAVTIEISPEGLRDYRLDSPVIPWSGITGIKGWEHRTGSYIQIGLDPDTEWEVLSRVPDRALGFANKLLGTPGLAINAAGTEIDTETLLAVCDAYWKAHRGS